MHALQERLLEKHADNRQVVVFVEEAQSMPIATLEEIRLLSNLETNRDKLLQIILFGQPELDDNLDKPEIRQLKERITHSFYLQPFTPEQMREYVNFRMRAVGYRGPDIFRGGAYRRMAKASGGLTRRINILADKALLAAFAEDTFDVGKRHVKIAVNDSQFARTRRWGLPEISLASGLVLIVIAVAWTFVQRSDMVSERLRQWLPGGASQQMSQPAGDQERSGHQASAAAVPESAQTDHQAAPVVDGPSSAGAGEDSTASVAPASAAQAQAPSAPPPMAIASGGSRLVLSDSLSQPPPSDAPMVEQVSTAAPDAMGSASGARQPSPAGSASMPEQAAEPAAEAVAVVSIDETIHEEAIAQAAIAQETVQTTASLMEERSAPVGEALGPLTEARLVATRDWLQAADAQHFSIQLLLTDFARRANLEEFLRERQSAGEVEDYFVFETRIRSNIWYGVLYKEYPSFAAAKAALEELPEEFRYHQPFIRNVRDIATLG
jgi:septal ring-binding cell division protein DamX